MADTPHVHMIRRARDCRSTVRVACLTVLILLTASVRSDAQFSSLDRFNSLEICNTGHTAFWVAIVEMSDGELFMSDRFYGEGWLEVKPGGCRNVFGRSPLDRPRAFLAIGYRDRFGDFGLAQVTPSSST